MLGRQEGSRTAVRVNTSRDDLMELSDFAWPRLRRRMDGLTSGSRANCRTIRQREDGDYVWDGPAPIAELGGPVAEDTRRALCCISSISSFITVPRRPCSGTSTGIDGSVHRRRCEE
jgi:hypothetical protein